MTPARTGIRASLARFDSVTPPRFRKCLTARVSLWTALVVGYIGLTAIRPTRAAWELAGLSRSGTQGLTALWCAGALLIGALTWYQHWHEQRSRHHHQLRDAIFQSAGFGMLLASHDQFIFDANPQACEMLGHTLEQLIGQHVDVLYGTRDEFMNFVEATQVQGTLGTVAQDWPILRRDGTRLWCTASTRLVDIRNPERGFIWGLTDTSGLRAVQAKLEQLNGDLVHARDDALRAVRTKTEFLANMSHEIRTPLHGILGAVALLQRTSLTGEQIELITAVSRSGDGLLTILNDILDYSKLEAGQLHFESVQFSPAREVRELALIFGTGIDADCLRLHVEINANVPIYVLGDSTRFRQVLSNLLSNSVKFTPKGSIHVRLQSLSSQVASCLVGLEVADTGIGISRDQQERLFRPFSQADGSTARRHGGSGLGLMLSKRLVEAMGGTISLFSQIGRGTTVRVEVPFAVAPSEPLEGHASKKSRQALTTLSAAAGQLARILIVEDVAVNQLIARKFVEKCGGIATVVPNGKEAVTAYRNDAFDAILMDCHMPEMDGYEATRQIRGIERDSERRIPIIAMTAGAMAEDRQRCLNAGMDDYITKPLSIEALGQCIDHWLHRSSAKSDC